MDGGVSDPVRLPAHCSTASADDTLRALLDRQKHDVPVTIDASAVTSIGQAVLQILVAGQIDCRRRKRAFVILDPSPAFLAAARTSRFDNHLDLVRE
jgi:anti-anti-sigma regulatory factor